MIAMTLGEIAAAVDGTVAPEAADVVVSGPPYVDNRDPVPGGLFVAVVGERVDGHEYADGAHAVLGSRATGAPTVVVDDPVVALGRLARHVVDRLDTTVIALTGSQGKTGTKDYLAQVLAGVGTTVATVGNHNNEIGVPLTVLAADADTRYLVVEMGARGAGTSPTCARSRLPRWLRSSTSARRTSASSGPVRRSRRPRARSWRPCRSTGPRCSTPATPWSPPWRRAPTPGS